MAAKIIGWIILLCFFAPVVVSMGILEFLGAVGLACALAYAIGMIVTGDLLGPIKLLRD